jgi:hypothetical protein
VSKNLRTKGLRLFYSYCHEDSGLRRKLEQHLALLKREGSIQDWFDGKIGAGVEVDKSIDVNLARSDIILLLISAAFLNSDYCWNREMVRAMRRHQRGDARVIPIIIRPVDDGWQETIFGKLKALPKDGKPVTKWSNRDSAWKDVAKGIRDAVKDLSGKRRAPRKRRSARRGGK